MEIGCVSEQAQNVRGNKNDYDGQKHEQNVPATTIGNIIEVTTLSTDAKSA